VSAVTCEDERTCGGEAAVTAAEQEVGKIGNVEEVVFFGQGVTDEGAATLFWLLHGQT